MKLRKNAFGYVTFGIGTMIMSVYLYTLFVSLFETLEKMNGVSIYIFGIESSLIVSALLLILFFTFFFFIIKIKSKCRSVSWLSNKVFSTICFYFCLALLLANLILMIFRVINGFAGNGYLQNQDYYLYFSGSDFVLTQSPIKKLYSLICIFLFKTFGVSFDVVLYFNAVLMIAGAVLLFFTVRFSFNRISAVFSLLLFSVFSSFDKLLADYFGYCFLFFIVSFVMFTVAYFMELVSRKKPVLSFVIVTGFIGLLVVLKHFLYEPVNIKFYLNEFLSVYSSDEAVVAYIAVVLLAVCGLICFIFSSEDYISFSVLSLLIIGFFMYFDYSTFDCAPYMYIVLGALAGNGLYSLIYKVYRNSEALKPAVVSEDSMEILTVPKVTTDEVKKSGNKIIEPINKTSNIIHQDEIKTEIKKPKFLDNPLPGPKKHVKKSITYAFEPSNDQMRYDIDISPDDDFDIK